jgi:hypothetical protein
LGAPDGWDHEKDGICHTLDIIDQDGIMYTFWRPTPAELVRLMEGHPLQLAIVGSNHPVVALSVAGEQ